MEGIKACKRTLITAFKKQQYYRHITIKKPFFREAHKQARLTWASLRRNWPP